MNKPLARLIMRKKKKVEGQDISEMKEKSQLPPQIKRVKEITTIFCHKLKNLEEIDKFLETYNFPRLNHENSLNRLITGNEIELVI